MEPPPASDLKPQTSTHTGGGRTLLLIVIIALLAVVVYLELKPQAPPAPPAAGPSAEHLRELAATLQANNLLAQAAEAYEDYLAAVDISDADRANVHYALADVQFTLADYEGALKNLYAVRIADPQSPVAADVKTRIVQCFERLGRTADAGAALDKLSGLEPAPESADSPAIATIGGRTITLADLQREIDLQAQINPYQGELDTPQAKLEFLDQYINSLLLKAKATNAGYDKEPEFRRKLGVITRGMLSQEVIQRDVEATLSISPVDVENFYKAREADFTEPARARIAHILAPTEDAAVELLAKAKETDDFAAFAREHSAAPDAKATGGEIRMPLVEGSNVVRGVGTLPELVKAVFAAEAGQVCGGVFKSAQGWHVVKVLERTPARVRPYDEIKSFVEQRYRAEKMQAAMDALVRQLRAQSEVKTFPEVLGNGPAAVDEDAKD